ncbi:hypothetical protein Hanom_Chr12g01168201 [Helianthus anomalus]
MIITFQWVTTKFLFTSFKNILIRGQKPNHRTPLSVENSIIRGSNRPALAARQTMRVHSINQNNSHSEITHIHIVP